MTATRVSGPSSFLLKLKHWAGLDRAIAFTVLGRFWSALAGAVTILLIARFLTPQEQGYYYTFYSLVALQVVFEMGFSFVILQLAAHERAGLTFLPAGKIEGDLIAHSRLASVLQKAVRWYAVAGLVMAGLLTPAGFIFFRAHQNAGPHIAWKIPWCLLVVAAMLAFQIDPVFSFLEGCGFITEVAHRRLTQALLGSFLAWAAMLTHHGLYSPAMVVFGQVAVGLVFLFWSKHRPLLEGLFFFPIQDHFVSWRDEIWPFQWKIAVSWICGYFIFQIFSPILFVFQGPVVAGQMGMSLSVTTALGSVAIAWMNTKASPFGAMVARGQFEELDKLFFRTLRQSTVLLITGGAAFFLFLLLGESYLPKLAGRVLPPWAFLLLLLNTITNHIIVSEAIYLRAHKQEPFLVPTIISAAIVSWTTFLLGKYWGANAVAVGLFFQGVVFALPLSTSIFFSRRKRWHEVFPSATA